MSRRRAPLSATDSRQRDVRTKERRVKSRTPRRSSRADVGEVPRSAKKQTRRLTKILLAVGLVVTVIGLGGAWAMRQPFLRVQHVTVVGARHESVSQVLQVSGLATHPSMFSLSSNAIERSLSALPWVKGVSVTQHWPNSVTLIVHESSPVAVAFNSAHQLQYVDAQGHDLGPAPLHANYPTLVYENPLGPTWPFSRAGSAAALVASQLPRAFSAQVSQILVNASGEVRLKMTTPVTFVLGPATELQDKFIAVASVLAHTTLGVGDVVDVTVPGELAVTGPAPS